MTRMASMVLLLAMVNLSVAPSPALACTGFGVSGADVALMAINYDWDVPGGRLIINPRAVKKTALVGEGGTPETWTSKFGSVTFNQYGREFPIGGMNQVGLAMQTLWLAETEYPVNENGADISALQWIQYSLDNFLTVEEVVSSAKRVNISSPAKLHFLACDRSRSCAVIEFIDGKPEIRAGRELPLPVIANSTYADSIEALNATLGYGGEVIKKADMENESLRRFVTAAHSRNALEFADLDEAVDGAFSILAEVARKNDNQWRIVYDLRTPAVHYTTKGNSARRSLDITAVDFHCLEAGVVALDLEGDESGDISGLLTPYSIEDNVGLVQTSIGRTEFLSEMEDSQIMGLAQYPSSLVCTSKKRPPNPKGVPEDSPPVIAVE